MITKREIIDTAAILGLNPHVVEKDYVLGWLLWGISRHEAIAESWMFKGGTCLKKCFFETYRFSEDLDFTLTDSSHIHEDFLKTVFTKIGERVYDQTGIELPPDYQRFEIYENSRGHKCCQGRIGYQGPVSPPGRNMPRIKLDLTVDEVIVLPSISIQAFHPYSDVPDGGIAIRSYAYEEVFGEKVRALAERARPRDLYNVINLFRNTESRPDAAVLRDVLLQKCAFKGIDLPTFDQLQPHRPLLESGWAQMLEHQLPALPPITGFWDELPVFFGWLEGNMAPSILAAHVSSPEEEIVHARTQLLPISEIAQSYLEIVRFAASNRLCVELDYQDSTRLIEPYSLRETKNGEILLHAHNLEKNQHRSYRVDRIQGAHVTQQTFNPRFEVELTPSGPIPIAATANRKSSFSDRSAYVYECIYCGKRFPRKKPTSFLNPHKDKHNYPCPGRQAYPV